MSTTIVIAAVCASAAWKSLGVVDAAVPQRLAMMRAEWQDKETWNHYNESQRQNELGLGLQVPGPAGFTLVAFTGVLRVGAATTPPAEVGVQVAVGRFGNPNAVRRPSLWFVAENEGQRPFRLDLSSRLMVDDPTPGAGTENGATMMKAAEFVRLVEAKSIAGEVLGLEATVRDDQLMAMREFAKRLRLKFNLPQAP